MKMISYIIGVLSLLTLCGCSDKIEISKAELVDKVKGGWAGQFLGCAYGGPTEFKYVNKIVPESVKLGFPTDKPLVKDIFDGLYDDIYMDATFVAVFEKYGLNAPRKEFAKAVAEANYELWCANKAARFEYLDGYNVGKPTSWKINPHSNDIDFQIEADFAGLMSPNMPQSAIKFCDTIGKIFNSGEGYYCGVYVATLYSLAFQTTDMQKLVEDALKAIPQQSISYNIVSDILSEYKKDKSNWLNAWHVVKKYFEKPCKSYAKQTLYAPYNLGYVVIGLLYGNGDFEKTIDISTRCGLDSDCNPATAGGIWATAFGYNKIPEKFRKPLELAENKLMFGTNYTPIMLYEIGTKQAIEVIEMNGGKINGEKISIPAQKIKCVEFETPMPDYKITKREQISLKDNQSKEITFKAKGIEVFVYHYSTKNAPNAKAKKFNGEIANVEVSLNGKPVRNAKFFGDLHRVYRKYAFADFTLPDGENTINLTFKKSNKLAADFFCEIRYYE
ncbi:MAG: ADP-ribosylglycohydrolase family protein [Opitutales bacterium]|nr:ADP-ribosylglycohydrolase family protein [Opitutales bacterium]